MPRGPPGAAVVSAPSRHEVFHFPTVEADFGFCICRRAGHLRLETVPKAICYPQVSFLQSRPPFL